MDQVIYLARHLMYSADNEPTRLAYYHDACIPDLYHFYFLGSSGFPSNAFCIYTHTNTLYLYGHRINKFPVKVQKIIKRYYEDLDFNIDSGSFKGGKDTMKKEDSDTSKFLDERAKLKIKIRKDVDTLSKDIVKKHSLDSAHSKADKIAKRIMKSMH